MWGAVAAGVAKGFGELMAWLGLREKRAERADAERTGAIKQRQADDRAAREAKDDQLKIAANRRRGDARRRLRKNDF